MYRKKADLGRRLGSVAFDSVKHLRRYQYSKPVACGDVGGHNERRTLPCAQDGLNMDHGSPAGETVLAATLGSSPSDLTYSTDESEMEIHCSQYRLQQHREQSSEEDTPTRRSKPSRSGRKRTTLDQRMKAWRKNEAARLAAWEAARLAAWEGLSTTQQPAGEPEHLEEELSMTQQLAGGSGSIPPTCNQRAASCPSPPEEELNMTQQLAGGPNSPRRHATRPAEHATDPPACNTPRPACNTPGSACNQWIPACNQRLTACNQSG
ncbi:hypothetical protein CYMTET_8586 [Cymbomonas tetramitiformis]|uniref:Uncharacterized protein n=1 Tax=Cymbomonas tetramitiformis TaxID=36881 RepID=A0AAE0LFP3_9CHLO|nr:hypothetical protein CYMTET_8586 [Cymbomonas tetramitiformis]